VAQLKVATCQFGVGPDIAANAAEISRLLAKASQRGARVAHFPEGALSGYAGTDFATFDGFDWEALRQATDDIARLAAELGIWVVLGSAHRLTGAHKPHNSLYVISDSGRLIDRYDKRFCSGDAAGRTGDLAHYAPGDHGSVWTIDGITCGALICYDYRFPELYRDYCAHGVQLMFHSFHAAAVPPGQFAAIGAAIGARYRLLNPAASYTYPGITMPAAMTAAAAANHIWISCPNSSAPESCWPAFFVRADGVTTGRLRRNVPGVLLSRVDTSEKIYDSTVAWRQRAIAGTLHSGSLVSDPRSADRTSLSAAAVS
jgi:deaminated glutathione amidase